MEISQKQTKVTKMGVIAVSELSLKAGFSSFASLPSVKIRPFWIETETDGWSLVLNLTNLKIQMDQGVRFGRFLH